MVVAVGEPRLTAEDSSGPTLNSRQWHIEIRTAHPHTRSPVFPQLHAAQRVVIGTLPFIRQVRAVALAPSELVRLWGMGGGLLQLSRGAM